MKVKPDRSSRRSRPHFFRPVLERLEDRSVPSAAFWSGQGGNPQHTALSPVATQPLNAIHWSMSVDPNYPGGGIHFASPMITPSNTVIVPIRSGFIQGQTPTTDTFAVKAM